MAKFTKNLCISKAFEHVYNESHWLSILGGICPVLRYRALLGLMSVYKLCNSKKSRNNLGKRFIILKRISTI